MRSATSVSNTHTVEVRGNGSTRRAAACTTDIAMEPLWSTPAGGAWGDEVLGHEGAAHGILAVERDRDHAVPVDLGHLRASRVAD